jgi:hypothetical protein
VGTGARKALFRPPGHLRERIDALDDQIVLFNDTESISS